MDRARSHTIGPNHLYIAQYSVCLYLTWRSPCNPESKFHQHFPNRISFYYVTFIIAFSMPPQHVYNSQKLKKWNLRPSVCTEPLSQNQQVILCENKPVSAKQWDQIWVDSRSSSTCIHSITMKSIFNCLCGYSGSCSNLGIWCSVAVL